MGCEYWRDIIIIFSTRKDQEGFNVGSNEPNNVFFPGNWLLER